MSAEWMVALVVFFLVLGLRLLQLPKTVRWREGWIWIWCFAAPLAFGIAAYSVASLTHTYYSSIKPSKQNFKPDDPGIQKNQEDQKSSFTILIGLVALTLTFLGSIALKTSHDTLVDSRDLKKNIDEKTDQLKLIHTQFALHAHIVSNLLEVYYLSYQDDDDVVYYDKCRALECWRDFLASIDPFKIPNLINRLIKNKSCHTYCPKGMRDYLILMTTSFPEPNQDQVRKSANRLLNELGNYAK